MPSNTPHMPEFRRQRWISFVWSIACEFQPTGQNRAWVSAEVTGTRVGEPNWLQVWPCRA